MSRRQVFTKPLRGDEPEILENFDSSESSSLWQGLSRVFIYRLRACSITIWIGAIPRSSIGMYRRWWMRRSYS